MKMDQDWEFRDCTCQLLLWILKWQQKKHIDYDTVSMNNFKFLLPLESILCQMELLIEEDPESYVKSSALETYLAYCQYYDGGLQRPNLTLIVQSAFASPKKNHTSSTNGHDQKKHSFVTSDFHYKKKIMDALFQASVGDSIYPSQKNNNRKELQTMTENLMNQVAKCIIEEHDVELYFSFMQGYENLFRDHSYSGDGEYHTNLKKDNSAPLTLLRNHFDEEGNKLEQGQQDFFHEDLEELECT